MVVGETNSTGVAQSYGDTMKNLMAEERARETVAGLETSNGMMISEALVPRLFKITHEFGEVAVAAGSGSIDMKPSSFPVLLEMMEMTNGTRCAEQILSYGEVEKVLIGGVLTMLTLITICGNLLVVISVCFVKKLRQPSNYLIVSLALADLSVALAVMPFVSITDLIGGRWIFGKFFCNVFIAMDVMCCTASIMTLCVISIDR